MFVFHVTLLIVASAPPKLLTPEEGEFHLVRFLDVGRRDDALLELL